MFMKGLDKFMVKKSINRYQNEMVMDVSSSNMHPVIVDVGDNQEKWPGVLFPVPDRREG